MAIDIQPASENAVILYLDSVPTAQTIGQLKALVKTIEDALKSTLVQVTPSYQSVLVQFDALQTDHNQVQRKILSALNKLDSKIPSHTSSSLVRLPVYYDTSVGPDLTRIAEFHDITVDDVIARHHMNIYNIYAIGFAPGFAYLGHVDDELATPRLGKPRPKVAKGSVAIADHQTAVYPSDSPGGWNIIGRCPCLLFDPSKAEPLPFAVGDRVQFMPISKDEFLYLGGSLDDL